MYRYISTIKLFIYLGAPILLLDTTTIGIIIAIGGICVAITSNVINFFYKKKTDYKSYNTQREAIARDVLKEQEVKAKELKLEGEELAKKVKLSMEEFVKRGDLDIRKDMAHNYALIQDKFDIMKLTIEHLNIQFINIQKSLDLLQQFYWGRDAKSLPPYVLGEEETQEHRVEEGHGIFRDTEQEAIDRDYNKTIDHL